jgi:hypothetical protein
MTGAETLHALEVIFVAACVVTQGARVTFYT